MSTRSLSSWCHHIVELEKNSTNWEENRKENGKTPNCTAYSNGGHAALSVTTYDSMNNSFDWTWISCEMRQLYWNYLSYDLKIHWFHKASNTLSYMYIDANPRPKFSIEIGWHLFSSSSPLCAPFQLRINIALFFVNRKSKSPKQKSKQSENLGYITNWGFVRNDA